MYSPFFACRKYAARGSLSTSVVICASKKILDSETRPLQPVSNKMQASPQQLMRRRAEWPTTKVARFCKARLCHHADGHHATQDSPPTPAGVQGRAHLVNARKGVHDDGFALHGPQQLAVYDVLAARR